MKFYLSIFFGLLLSACSHQNFISHFVNNAELIASTEDKSPTLSVKIYKLAEQGECSANHCPHEKLYIAVSEFGEYPEQKLYKTEETDSWEFLNWKTLPTLGQLPYSVSFEVQKTENTVIKIQQITVSLDDIQYQNK